MCEYIQYINTILCIESYFNDFLKAECGTAVDVLEKEPLVLFNVSIETAASDAV